MVSPARPSKIKAQAMHGNNLKEADQSFPGESDRSCIAIMAMKLSPVPRWRSRWTPTPSPWDGTIGVV